MEVTNSYYTHSSALWIWIYIMVKFVLNETTIQLQFACKFGGRLSYYSGPMKLPTLAALYKFLPLNLSLSLRTNVVMTTRSALKLRWWLKSDYSRMFMASIWAQLLRTELKVAQKRVPTLSRMFVFQPPLSSLYIPTCARININSVEIN